MNIREITIAHEATDPTLNKALKKTALTRLAASRRLLYAEKC
ncbi:hypothetical protein [Paracoccus albus]|nr:hypothetical protein [Paracoccus albus]WBU61798.1 hypothetical protein PAF20_07890 [Paracoccus albus]